LRVYLAASNLVNKKVKEFSGLQDQPGNRQTTGLLHAVELDDCGLASQRE
jgi:hypothetical protein